MAAARKAGLTIAHSRSHRYGASVRVDLVRSDPLDEGYEFLVPHEQTQSYEHFQGRLWSTSGPLELLVIPPTKDSNIIVSFEVPNVDFIIIFSLTPPLTASTDLEQELRKREARGEANLTGAITGAITITNIMPPLSLSLMLLHRN